MKQEIKIDTLNDQIKDVDLYICSVSFEDRCSVVTDAIDKKNVQSVAMFYNKNEESCFTKQLSHIESQWGEKVNKIGICYNDASDIADKFGDFFCKKFTKTIGNILLDCTTFTHEGLLIVLKYLYENRNQYDTLYVVYVCADSYSTNTSDPNKKWLTKGIHSTKTILGYPGIFNPSKKNHLIVLFGFELERTIKLVDQMDFDKITLCFGAKSDSIYTQHYQVNKARHEEMLSMYPNADKLEISLRDPGKTKAILLDYLKEDTHNVVIAPMNNKISTIGVAMAAIENPDIQLVYSKANEYNLSYSTPSKDLILFSIWDK